MLLKMFLVIVTTLLFISNLMAMTRKEWNAGGKEDASCVLLLMIAPVCICTFIWFFIVKPAMLKKGRNYFSDRFGEEGIAIIFFIGSLLISAIISSAIYIFVMKENCNPTPALIIDGLILLVFTPIATQIVMNGRKKNGAKTN